MTPRNSRPNPYVGPRSFNYGEKIFGREREERELLELLIAERIVLMYSPSGAGKTSLIQAALIPLLENKRFSVIPAANQAIKADRVLRVSLPSPPGEELPSGHNRYVLSLLCSLEDALPPERKMHLPELAKIDLATYLNRLLDVDGTKKSTALIIDQFEEILTLDLTDCQAKTEFFHQLGEALSNKDIWALFAMREEYIAGLDPYLRFIPTRLKTTYRLDFLREEPARQAIRQPVEQVGVKFTEDAAQQLVDDLRLIRVRQLDGTMTERPGPYVEPVQLQVVCHQLWEMLASDDMEIDTNDIGEVGDVNKALYDYYADRVEAVATESGVSERKIREWFDKSLITEQGIRGQVLESPDQSEGLDNRAIKLLVDAHLVRAENRRSFTWFELAHDRLINPVRNNNQVWFEAHLSILQRQALLWKTNDRPAGLLLTGKPLEEASQWALDNNEKLTDNERSYLEECFAARLREHREQRFNNYLRFATIAMILLLGALGWEVKKVKQSEAKVKETYETLNNTYVTLKKTNFSLISTTHKLKIANKTAMENYSTAKAETARANKNANEAKINLAIAEETARALKDSEQEAIGLRDDAITAKDQAITSARIALSRQLGAQAAARVIEQPDLALLLGLEANNIDDGPESRHSILTTLVRTPAQLLQYLRGHKKPVWHVAFNPNGKRLATGGDDGTVILWNMETLRPSGRPLTEHEGEIRSLSFSPKGDILATIDASGTMRLWDSERAKLINTVSPESEQEAFWKVVFRPKDSLLAAGMVDGTIRIYDLPSPELLRGQDPLIIIPPKGKLLSLSFRPDGEVLAIANESKDPKGTHNNIRLCEVKTGSIIAEIPDAERQEIFSVAFSSDGNTLASSGKGQTISLWNVQDPKYPRRMLPPLTGHTDSVTKVAFSPDDRVLYSTSGDNSIRLWDTATGQQIGRQLTGQGSAILSMEVSKDGYFMASGGMDGNVIVWGLSAEHRIGTPTYGKLNSVRSVAFSPDGRKLASAGHDNNVIIWDLASQKQVSTPLIHGKEGSRSWVTSLIFHPQEEILYTGSTDGIIRIWDTQKHELISETMKHDNDLLTLALSNNSEILASGDNEKNIFLWNLKERKPLHTSPLMGHKDAIWSLAFNGDDTILASGGDDNTVRLWDVQSGEPIGVPLEGHSGRISCMAFRPSLNDSLYTASKDEIIRWDLSRSPPSRSVFKFPDPNINAMAFSPDGSVLAVGGNKTVTFLNPETGKVLFMTDEKLGRSIWSVAFDRLGKTVASGSNGGIVTLWNPRTGKWFGREMLGHHLDISQMALSADGSLLAFSSGDNKVEIRHLNFGTNSINPVELKLKESEKVTAIVFAPDDAMKKQLVTASDDGNILLWDLSATPPSSSDIANETGYITTALAISPKGNLLAAGENRGGITIWDLAATPPAGYKLPNFGNRDGEPVTSLAFSKDGSWLVSGSYGEIILWDVANKEQVGKYPEDDRVISYKQKIVSLQFSPTDDILAAEVERGKIILWDFSDPNNVNERSLKGHAGPSLSISFSSDGKLLASGSFDKSVRIWDVASGRQIGPALILHKDAVYKVAFTKKNKQLLSAGADGVIISWDIDIDENKKKAIDIAARNFSPQELSYYGLSEEYQHPMPLLHEAHILALAGETQSAKDMYSRLVDKLLMNLESDNLNRVCWVGSLDGFADIVIPACNRAVNLAPPDAVNNYRDTRGVALSMASRPEIDRAIADFQAFIRGAEEHPMRDQLKDFIDRRRKWIKVLQGGGNPFDEETLRVLINETMP
ncbi:MAG: hypothetical protein ED859_14220 [Desulfuromonadales bacterium]|nr:MAG: hypothetical protein ED859_14220 [Desulfuromonadales bacterium]